MSSNSSLPMLMLFQSFSFVKTVHELCQSHCLTGCLVPVQLPWTLLLKQDGRSPFISLSSIFFKINGREGGIRSQEESTSGGRMQLISENSFCKVNLHSLIGKSRSDTPTCEEMALHQNRQMEAFCSFSHETEAPHPFILHAVPQNKKLHNNYWNDFYCTHLHNSSP